MKVLITVLFCLFYLVSNSNGQNLTPSNISDFLHSQNSYITVMPTCWDVTTQRITPGITCDRDLLSFAPATYNSRTVLINDRAFNKYVVKNFVYTIVGEEKATNGVSVDIAAPKIRLSGVTSLNEGKALLKTEFSGGLGEDGRGLLYSANNFNSEIGLSVGISWLRSKNRSGYKIDGSFKKLVHSQVIDAAALLKCRLDTLVAIHRWIYSLTDYSGGTMWASPIYDYITTNYTSYVVSTSAMSVYNDFLTNNNIQNRLRFTRLAALATYAKKFSDIKITEAALQAALPQAGPFPGYAILEDNIDYVQDSLAKPYWNRNTLRWFSIDLKGRHFQLNSTNIDGVSDKKTGNPFHDISVIFSHNYLVTNPTTKNRFVLLRAFAHIGRGTNIRSLSTVKIDKDVFYKGQIKQVNYAGFGIEAYGNPFTKSGLPGLYFNTRFDYSVDYKNPWIIGVEGGPLFNLQDKKSNNFAFISPTFGFTDIAEPGIDIGKNFVWSLKVGIPVNVKWK